MAIGSNVEDTDTSGEKALEELAGLGTEITGGVFGAAAGFVIGGPLGAVGGSALSPVAVRALRGGADFVQRHLSHRERVRVGAVIQLAAAHIAEAIAAGRSVREDDFFRADEGRRPQSAEIVEGVLQAAQREYEERKLPYFANLLAEIALRPDVDGGAANLYIRAANSVSYRQLQLLSLFARSQIFQLPPGNYRERPLWSGDPVVPILSEIFDLLTRQFAQVPGSYTLGLLDVTPSQIKLIGTGSQLVELMLLETIPPEELVPIQALLFRSLGGEPTTAIRPS